MKRSDLKVFIVDDIEEVASAISDYLSNEGFKNIRHFINPALACLEVRKESVGFKRSVVITDYNMPVITDTKLLEQILSVVPVNGIIITSEPDIVPVDTLRILDKGGSVYYEELCAYLEKLVLLNCLYYNLK